MTRSSSAAVVAAAILLISAAVRPASAEVTAPSPAASRAYGAMTPAPTPTTRPVRWNDGGCATGSIGPLERDAQNHVMIPAEIALCRPWLAKYAFTVVAFRADRPPLAVASRLRRYEPGEPTVVRAAFHTVPTWSPVGVCLMRSADVRLACLRLDIAADGEMVAAPLPTDDPLVNRPVHYVDDSGDPEPGAGFCATCLGLGF
ncbi:hypothetical protein [Actinoplanes sp. NPDC049599]|uniref:hypothetical protein n=1 Tax=Actinoplanes sp. NPDC049599 TaxID=3363903 RepID=UPI003788D25F